jgi:hypothetical protein
MGGFFLVLAVVLLVLTAAVHSVMGERRLLKPLLAQFTGILGAPLARFILRAVWHFTSLSWLVLAAILLTLGFQPQHALRIALAITGAAFTAAGIIDLAGSRGKHIGWPLLTAIGLAALLGATTAP